MLYSKHIVHQNCKGFLFRKKKLSCEYGPGIYRIFEFLEPSEMLCLPITERPLVIANQEVLTKDGIALRASFSAYYKIVDFIKVLDTMDLSLGIPSVLGQLEQRVHNCLQIRLRDIVSGLLSEELNEKRQQLGSLVDEKVHVELAKVGLRVERADFRDLSFPKAIQELFARHLEAKIRSKADLENARTAVAAARALKNASEITKGDDAIRFYQYLELLSKIAAKGKHTFIIGDPKSVPSAPNQA